MRREASILGWAAVAVKPKMEVLWTRCRDVALLRRMRSYCELSPNQRMDRPDNHFRPRPPLKF